MPWGDGRAIVIAGADQVGCLYGVYGLLDEHYGIGFYLGGDVLPEVKRPLLVDVDERKTPAVAIRGYLPWTNFPQSAVAFSWEDWRFVLDQTAKMRMNFLLIHNNNGEAGQNEMFHNFKLGNFTSRTWMSSARRGHGWNGLPGDPNRYLFGAADLFDDYDAGADCTLHNENLTNEQVSRKGITEFQRILAYAHSRGIKIALGIDINLVPGEYKAKANDPAVIAARVAQLTGDYPDLDYLFCFQSEGMGGGPNDPRPYETWRRMFMGFYDGFKARSPRTRLAVAGWGLVPKSIAELPGDVIWRRSPHYADTCESGAVYGAREYWGCPWMERDFHSSEYYYPYNIHLSNTIKAWQGRAANMEGFYCLAWRLTDALDAKLSYMAKAPWDSAGKYTSSAAVYGEYARRNYGAEAAKTITPIIDQNEPFASDFGECEPTPGFGTGEGQYILNIAQFKLHAGDAAAARPIPATSFNKQSSGVRAAPCAEGGACAGWIANGDWIRFDRVDFGAGATAFEARVAAAIEGSSIALRLDKPDGPLLGTCPVPNTGGWQTWKTVKIPLVRTAGPHMLYLVFRSTFAALQAGRLRGNPECRKAMEQLAVIDRSIAAAQSPAQQFRLRLLRCRIAAAADHVELNQMFNCIPGGPICLAASNPGRRTSSTG